MGGLSRILRDWKGAKIAYRSPEFRPRPRGGEQQLTPRQAAINKWV